MTETTQATHSPAPWEIRTETVMKPMSPPIYIKHETIFAGGKPIAEVFPNDANQRADAEFIVLAVNSHEALVAACEAAESLLRECSPAIRIGFDYTNLCSVSRDPDELADQLRAAVAKAKGQAA